MLDRYQGQKDKLIQSTKHGFDTTVKTVRRATDGSDLTLFAWVMSALGSIAILIIASLWALGLILTKPDSPKGGRPEHAFAVNVKDAELATNMAKLVFYGEVVSSRSVDIRASAAGEIIEVNPKVQIGARIAEGGLLVKIDPFNYEGAKVEAEANLAEAKISLAEAKANLATAETQYKIALADTQRAEKLRKRGTLDQRQLENRKLTLTQRQSSLDLAKAKLEQQFSIIKRLEWRLEQANRNLENTIVRAPFDGVIQNEIAEVGRRLNNNEVIITMYEPRELDVRFTMSNQQFGRLSEKGLWGRKAAVTWDVAPSPKEFKAIIQRSGAEVQAKNGGVEIFAKILGPDLASLRPGTFVEILVDGVSYENTVSVPETAVYQNSYLYVMQEGRMYRRDIQIVDSDRENLIITGDIKSGDQLILSRLAQAGDGVKVIDVKEIERKRKEAADAKKKGEEKSDGPKAEQAEESKG